MDRETLVTGPRSAAQGGPVRTKTEYDAAGRVMRVTRPKGVATSDPDDYVTETVYDLLDRESTITRGRHAQPRTPPWRTRPLPVTGGGRHSPSEHIDIVIFDAMMLR
jgi:hypothetical protein